MAQNHAEKMAEMAGGRNRRRFTRVALDAQVQVRLGEGTFESRLKDLSRNGVFILTPETRPIGTGLELSITVTDGGSQVRARGIIVHEVTPKEAAPGRPAGIGVMFLEVQEGEDVLEEIVSNRTPLP
jgi:Tfp pilus assembly protein PilZ